MPFYGKDDVRIRYEESGSGFPLLVTPSHMKTMRNAQRLSEKQSLKNKELLPRQSGL